MFYNNIEDLVFYFNQNENAYTVLSIYMFILFIFFPYLFFLYRKIRGNVIIIRGLPGSGKSFYADRIIESIKPKNYVLLDMYKYWNSDCRKKVSNIQLLKCWTNCIADYIYALNSGVEMIIITNPFIKKWEYKIYLELCKKFHYQYEIYQIEAESKEQAKYFQKRSSLNMLDISNNYYYKKWESDDYAINILPDCPELLGDSYPDESITKEDLDRELDEYNNN